MLNLPQQGQRTGDVIASPSMPQDKLREAIPYSRLGDCFGGKTPPRNDSQNLTLSSRITGRSPITITIQIVKEDMARNKV